MPEALVLTTTSTKSLTARSSTRLPLHHAELIASEISVGIAALFFRR
jgi:hypothetical protein